MTISINMYESVYRSMKKQKISMRDSAQVWYTSLFVQMDFA